MCAAGGCEPFDLFITDITREFVARGVDDSAPKSLRNQRIYNQATKHLRARFGAPRGDPGRERGNVVADERKFARLVTTYNCSVGLDFVNGVDAAPYGTECDVAGFCGEGYSPLVGIPSYSCAREGWRRTGTCARGTQFLKIRLEKHLLQSDTGLRIVCVYSWWLGALPLCKKDKLMFEALPAI